MSFWDRLIGRESPFIRRDDAPAFHAAAQSPGCGLDASRDKPRLRDLARARHLTDKAEPVDERVQ